MTDGLDVRVSGRLTAAEAAEVQEFLAASPVGTYLQRPDWPDLCPPPRRHSHLCLRAYRDGRLVGWALARLSPLAFGYRLAFLRRGPVTRDVSDLDQVLPAFGRALRKAG
ncbi:MAG: hypothetical protein WAT09_05055, partial [Paracoccaceae bacterium]